MVIRNLAQELETRLAESLARFPADVGGRRLRLPTPMGLAKRCAALAQQFDEGKPAEPPSQARINALARLRRGEPDLTRKDWALIAWGLCDDCGRAGKPIEVQDMFSKVIHYVDQQQSHGGVGRKIWFGLLHSYFAYSHDRPADNPNWATLRSWLASSLPLLIRAQVRPKAWAKALESQRELLTPQAGQGLSEAMLTGECTQLDEINRYFPVPETSWLWRAVISRQIDLLATLADIKFLPVIPVMLALAKQHAYQADAILAALLTRYEQASYRDQPHEGLKQFALERWHNPQVKSANRWSAVSEEVRGMVLQWFARADLEHFFSLLQGEGGVDRARLRYWLRFVNQIGYTRIVMGNDAFYNSHPDFSNFRAKNKGRYSHLIDNNTANNGFVMSIGDYYFVEFSGTGNACYIYSNRKLPFDPDRNELHLTGLSGLKQLRAAVDRIIHNGSWEYKADRQLAQLGIYPDDTNRPRRPPRHATAEENRAAVPLDRTQTSSALPASQRDAPAGDGIASASGLTIPTFTSLMGGNRSSISAFESSSVGHVPTLGEIPGASVPQGSLSTDQAIEIALGLAMRSGIRSDDHRAKGGAFWILHGETDSELSRRLVRLGFNFHLARGYWIK